METLRDRRGWRSLTLLFAVALIGGPLDLPPGVAAKDTDSAAIALMRGDAAQTGQMPGPAPTSAPEQLWFAPGFNGRGFAPLVVGDLIIGMAGGGEDLVALETATGSERWRVARGRQLLLTAIPASAGGLIYITGREDEGDRLAVLLALDVATGEEVWRLRLPDAGRMDEWTSPLAADGTLYLAATSGVAYALDTATGEEIWRAEAGNATFPPPALADGRLIFLHEEGLLVLDEETGEEIWRGGVPRLAQSIAVEDGLILAITEGESMFTGGEVHAIDLASGEERWFFAGDNGISSLLAPAVRGGTVYVSGLVEEFYALDAVTGEVIWQKDGDFDPGSPAMVGDAVYLPIGAGFSAFDAMTGEVIWSVENWSGEDEFTADAPPVIAGGRIFVYGGDGVVALGDSDAA